MKKKLIVVLSVIGISLIIVVFFLILNRKRVQIQKNDSIVYLTDKEFIDAYEYIFVAKIKKEVETKQYGGSGLDIPYTFYNIEIIDYLKGIGEKEGRICFCGGKLYLNTWSLYSENDEIIQNNQYYLFFANKTKNPSERVKENDFMLYHNQQKILLEGYDRSTSLSAQSADITQTIKRYKNVIDKVMEYDLGLPKLNTTEEIVNNYSYIFIWTVTEAISRSNENPKENIAIPQVSYKGDIHEVLKEDVGLKDVRICFVGVNYWYNENPVGLDLPQQNHTYLLLGNNFSDTIVIEAMHQCIELEGYDPNKGYMDQEPEIKGILQAYLNFIG